MTTTLAGLPVLSLALTIPRRGSWSASVVLEGEASPAGDVDLVLEGRTWRGRVHRGGNELGRWHGTIVGGAQLLADVEPEVFAGATLREVFVETLRAAGLSPSADLGDLSAVANHWHRITGPAGRTLAAVADAAGYGWRVRADGTVWAGPETWAAQPIAGAPIEVLDINPALGRYQLAGDAALDLLPGRTIPLDGAEVRVGLIEHHQTGAALRTVVWSERTTDVGRGADRLRAALVEIVRAEMRALSYALWRPCTVLSQDGDTLDLRPDDPDLRPPRGVPYRTLPGVRLTIPAGTRVLLGYEGADPRRPVAILAEYASVTQLAVNGGSARAAREGDTTDNGSLVVTAASLPTVPPTSSLTLTYTPPGGVAQVVAIVGLPPGVTVTGPGSLGLSGEIDSGTGVFRLPDV